MAKAMAKEAIAIKTDVRDQVASQLTVVKKTFLKGFSAYVIDKDPSRLPALYVGSRIPWVGMHAVSYTHLAVYKRQALLCAAHAALMLDVNLGGLALGVREVESEWEVDDADGVAASTSARYQITYRTLISDISIQA